jgi:hypothetical protein
MALNREGREMSDLRLPFKIRWFGEPVPDLTGIANPLAIPFSIRPAAISRLRDADGTADDRDAPISKSEITSSGSAVPKSR